MFYTGANEFNWTVDNFGTNFNYNGFATAITSGAANTKGAITECIAAAALTEDCYLISINVGGGVAPGSRRNFIADIMVDEAGGTNWSVLIPNLLFHQNNMGLGYHFVFPLFVKAGSSVGARVQCNAPTISPRVGIKLFGKPTHPHLMRYGHTVEAIGVDTTNTLGTLTGSGTNNWSAWASLGTSVNDNWWWQLGACCTDTTMGVSSGLTMLELSAGDATNKKQLISAMGGINDAGENSYKPAFGCEIPIKSITAGDGIYARNYSNSTPDSSWYMSAYGLK